MVNYELLLFVGPDGPGKRRVQLKSPSLRKLCIRAEDIIREHHREGHIAWLCAPPVAPTLSLSQRITLSDHVKEYLADVLLELEMQAVVNMKVNGPVGPIRSAA